MEKAGKQTGSWFSAETDSFTPLLHERGCALAYPFKRHFESVKFLGAQLREHSLHLPGMLSKVGNNEILAAWGEGNDPNAPVFGALNPADQALRDEAIDSDTDRAWGQIDDWAYRIERRQALGRFHSDPSVHGIARDFACGLTLGFAALTPA
jgi:hypothetical protein